MERFLHVLLGLIIVLVGSGLGFVDDIVDELGSFILIGFSDGSLVWNIVVRAYR